MSDPLTLTINGQQYEVGSDVTSTSRLANFLADNQLLGTNTTCYEGGCGACTVVATVTDPNSGDKTTQTVNSCLVPTLACVGWEITTIEGLGNKYDGYHPIQMALVKYSGTQCGYCSPGMVMNMYGLTEGKPGWTESDVEQQLDGTMCRCTGYRPILEAFKSITPQDIEDAGKVKCLKKGQCCKGKCSGKAKVSEDPKSAKVGRTLSLKASNWHQSATLQELYDTLAGLPDGTKYTLVCGNTAQAVYNDGPYTEYIYTRNISEFSGVTVEADAVVFGAAVSISRVMEELGTVAAALSGYSYATELVKMWRKLASTSVRNLGSWAGNLAVKVAHPEFPSDLFTGLLAAEAKVTTATTDGVTTEHTLEELLQLDLMGEKRIILALRMVMLPDDAAFRAYKVLPRATNAKADVNAGFQLRVDTANNYTVQGSPIITYGGINPTFVRATATEAVLAGNSLKDESVLQAALSALATEILPDNQPIDASPEYRVAVAQNLLYKTVLSILGTEVNPGYTSGATMLERPLSSGQQIYDLNTETYPVGQPMHKIEAPIQCSGEAEFIHKKPSLPGELFGMFVTSTQGNAHIVSIDPSAALAIPGVVDFVGVDDITGTNNIMVYSWPGVEQLFPTDRVGYYGQPLGLIVATDRGTAYAGRAAVQVTYDDIQPPILTIDEAMQSPYPDGQPDPIIVGDVAAGFAASTQIIEGSMRRNGQFHFHMEPQISIVNPNDNGLDVYSASQWIQETRAAIAQVTGLSEAEVNVNCKRLGGAFGGKIDRCNIVATAAGLAAQKTRKPVRVQLDLDTNMTMIGWREPYLCNYKVGVDDSGVLQAVQVSLIADSGYVDIDWSSLGAADAFQSCYTCPNWDIQAQFVLTNTACNTWCRTPGTLEGVTFMENLMEHVAAQLNMDPLELRQKNLIPDGDTRRINKDAIRLKNRMGARDVGHIPHEIKVPKNLLTDMISQIMVSADVDNRKAQIATFNQSNTWKKRGLSVMTMLWPYAVPSVYPFASLVSVSGGDGTVTISHGGSEMGQGLNTKVAQVAAYELGIPLSSINFIANNTHTNANSSVTGGSLGSDICANNVGEGCKLIKGRLEAMKAAKGVTGLSWVETVKLAFAEGVDISQRYVNAKDEVLSYAVFGVTCTEVELDVLTGQFIVLRTDILEDAGASLSPLVDVGQIEGGFVMGQGVFTTEHPVYDPTTGQRLSNSTWNYKPPFALDIPADFRITILQNAPNPIGVQSSKVTSEPPVCLSFTVPMALRQAVASARADAGNTDWFQMDTPLTTERLQTLCLVDASRLKLT